MKTIANLRRATLALILMLGLLGAVSPARADGPDPKPTVVLVHAAFDRAASWKAVAALLRADGFPVVIPVRGDATPDQIASFLENYAAKIDAASAEIVQAANEETGLPASPRLQSNELPRTINQLRLAATAAREESWKRPTLDLKNNISIEIQTASFRTVRGYTIIAALCDALREAIDRYAPENA